MSAADTPMTTDSTPLPDLVPVTSLAFGWREGSVPPMVPAAMGARLNVTQDGGVDLVHDRVSFIGAAVYRERLLAHLDAVVKNKPHLELRRMLINHEISTRICGEQARPE